MKKQVLWSALVLHAIVLICWMAYSYFQPILFSQFGLDSISEFYHKAQNLLLVFIPPLAGFLADKYFYKKKSRLPFFQISIMATACLFLALSGIFITRSSSLTAIIPYLMILWIIGMNIFYNPGVSIIAEAAEGSGSKRASALIGSVTDFLWAIMAYLLMFFQKIGHIPTFIIGAVLLIVAFYFYRSATQNTPHKEKIKESFPFDILKIGKALFIGILLGIFHHILLHHAHEQFIHAWHVPVISIILILCAIMLIIFHHHLNKLDLFTLFLISFSICCGSTYMIMHQSNDFMLLLGSIFMIPGILGVTGSAFGAGLSNVPDNWLNTTLGFIWAGFSIVSYF